MSVARGSSRSNTRTSPANAVTRSPGPSTQITSPASATRRAPAIAPRIASGTGTGAAASASPPRWLNSCGDSPIIPGECQTGSPVAASNSRTVVSSLVVATRRPSGLNRMKLVS